MSSTTPVPVRRDVLSWIGVGVAGAALAVVAWACLTGWGGIVHGHPAYAILLSITALGALGFGAIALLRPVRAGLWRRIGRIAAVVLALLWVFVLAWLRPYPAVEPALEAMRSDASVDVVESGTRIVMQPTGGASATGIFFQPGALVDPRAYAAVLRPLAESGYTVVIVKQPLGIAFFSLGEFDAVVSENSDVQEWVLAGHSLGGTVAAIQADGDATGVAAGLVFYASYPASDISATLDVPTLSISGTRDGLATPDKIDASRADLPAATQFVVVEGASHAQFGAYGPQPGDNEPEISDDDARAQISSSTLDFIEALAG
ncbi:alpha/beta hydrolase [Microbacterium sediminicola]